MEHIIFSIFHQSFKDKYGDKLAFNKSATNTLRLFYNKEDLQHFFNGFQAKYWSQHGYPFVQINPEKCKKMVPEIGKRYPNIQN